MTVFEQGIKNPVNGCDNISHIIKKYIYIYIS